MIQWVQTVLSWLCVHVHIHVYCTNLLVIHANWKANKQLLGIFIEPRECELHQLDITNQSTFNYNNGQALYYFFLWDSYRMSYLLPIREWSFWAILLTGFPCLLLYSFQLNILYAFHACTCVCHTHKWGMKDVRWSLKDARWKYRWDHDFPRYWIARVWARYSFLIFFWFLFIKGKS